MNITLFNTFSNQEEVIRPLQDNEISMYVCGPTVYDTPHIGNMRSNIFYDLLFRVFRGMYSKVTYVRNITDIDDKIINRAKTEGITCAKLTERTIKEFHKDLESLNCISPTYEPKATEYIPQIIEMIERLVKNGYAYCVNGEYLFSVSKYQYYGQLSNKKLADLMAGSRVNVQSHKHSPEDFVLWKNVDSDKEGFETSLGYGRPGWHIECSAMATELLGKNFDIHGGGVDLQFPHHENEIAQSCCANLGSNFAKYWVHNGFLKVDGAKMSKSLNNFITVRDIIKNTNPLVLRLCLLATHYRKPLDFNQHSLKTAEANLEKFNKTLKQNADLFVQHNNINLAQIPKLAQEALLDNLNISKYLAIMHTLPKDIKNTTTDKQHKKELAQQFWNMGALIGIFK